MLYLISSNWIILRKKQRLLATVPQEQTLCNKTISLQTWSRDHEARVQSEKLHFISSLMAEVLSNLKFTVINDVVKMELLPRSTFATQYILRFLWKNTATLFPGYLTTYGDAFLLLGPYLGFLSITQMIL